MDPWGKELSLCPASFRAANGARAYELVDTQQDDVVGVIHLAASGWAVEVGIRPLFVTFDDKPPPISARSLYSLASDPRLLKLAVATR
ncbi:hypothetical protein [Streptomyces sp. AC627_RSS907]|uniref:hypothetical protein n=1 Tax=Streptomyces sp. AC627_RSS907 TaxID=2823684 RepID=UPI001C2158C7|nr:hypothetical protein [Streptomyces sp. AC627_RSS907]